MKFKAGLPLAEVLGYIGFLSVFLLIGGFSVNAYNVYATNQEALAGASTIGAAISQYKFEVGTYPNSLNDLTTTKNQYGPWLIKLPTDPWTQGKNFQYLHNNSSFAVFSVGKDGGVNSTIKSISSNDI